MIGMFLLLVLIVWSSPTTEIPSKSTNGLIGVILITSWSKQAWVGISVELFNLHNLIVKAP